MEMQTHDVEPPDLKTIFEFVQKEGMASSPRVARQFDIPRGLAYRLLRDTEAQYSGKIVPSSGGFVYIGNADKKCADRHFGAGKHVVSVVKRQKEVAKELHQASVVLEKQLRKLFPDQKVAALEADLSAIRTAKLKEEKNVVAEFDFDEKGKMSRGFSAGKE